MNQLLYVIRVFSILALLAAAFSFTAFAQGEASGGTIPGSAKPKKGSDPSKSVKAPASKPAPNRATTVDRIDGKWWTTGNGFGDSEVVFTQNGADVTGVIKFADGRTGTINGRMANKRLQHTWSDSRGNSGVGWLELSWANFLGGAWHNDRVKDGSWTLNRIEGQWCLGGERSRIRRVTHDEKGYLTVRNEDGSGNDGHMEGPWLFLDSDGMSIKGSMFYKGNRVDWSSGAYWTWCGR